MRRWWILHFGPGDYPYQVNLLGLAIGVPLGLLGALIGYAIGGRQNATGGGQAFGGLLMVLPAAIYQGIASELMFGKPITSIGTRIGLVVLPAVVGLIGIVARPASIDLHKAGAWLIIGMLVGGFLGLNTQQYQYPPRKGKKKKKRKRPIEDEYE